MTARDHTHGSTVNSNNPTNRQAGVCPVCGDSYGRQERSTDDEVPAVRFWHTDLTDVREFCIEKANGEKRKIREN